jgi:hypothetical protein
MVLNLMDRVKKFWKRPDSDYDPQQCYLRMVLILMDLVKKIFRKRPDSDPDPDPQQCDLRMVLILMDLEKIFPEATGSRFEFTTMRLRVLAIFTT